MGPGRRVGVRDPRELWEIDQRQSIGSLGMYQQIHAP